MSNFCHGFAVFADMHSSPTTLPAHRKCYQKQADRVTDRTDKEKELAAVRGRSFRFGYFGTRLSRGGHTSVSTSLLRQTPLNQKHNHQSHGDTQGAEVAFTDAQQVFLEWGA